MKYSVYKMSHLGQTADLAGAGFHNTSLSRLKVERTKEIYWNFLKKKKKFHCASSWPHPNLGHLLNAAQNWSRQEHKSTYQNQGRECTILHLSPFHKPEVVIHQWTTTPSQVPQSTCSCQHSVMISKTKTFFETNTKSFLQRLNIPIYTATETFLSLVRFWDFFLFTHIF